MPNRLLKFFLFAAVFAGVILISCGGGPVGGFKASVNINDSLAQFTEARIYVDKINLFTREDNTTGYETLPGDAQEFEHMLFTLVGGEKGADPMFSLSWIMAAKSVEEIVGRNVAAYSVKMFPDITEYRKIAKTTDYIASYNEKTCYILLTITNVNAESKWINGIFNGVYIEKVGDRWRRMELREGRFGANYIMSPSANPTGEQL